MDILLKILFAIIINGFGIIVYWSFRHFKIGKKDTEYLKTIAQFGLEARKEVIDGEEKVRKPSTVLRPKNYWLPLIFFTITCTILSSLFLFPNALFDELFQQGTNTFAHNPFFLGSYFGLSDINGADTSIGAIQRRSIATVTWAFIGAFLWSASNMVRRLAKGDITPVLYYKASFRLLFACSVALVFSFVADRVNLGGQAFTSALVPAIAFLAGTLPERFFNYLTGMLKNIFTGKDVNTKELNLRNIEGLSISHRERLWEEGIDNAQNLAQASLTDLMLKTPFEARQILDWIGQAKLLTHMKEDIERAYAIGIRSIYDFVSLKETYNKRGLDNMAAIQELGESAGFSTYKLAVVSELANESVGVRNLKDFMDKLNGESEEERTAEKPKEVYVPLEPIKPQPVKPVEPIQPIKPVEPTEPVQPKSPVKPVEEIEGLEPIHIPKGLDDTIEGNIPNDIPKNYD